MSSRKDYGGLPENRPEEITRKINEIKMDQFLQYYCPARDFGPGRASYGAGGPGLAEALVKGLGWLRARLPQPGALSWTAKLPFLVKRMKEA